jgi:hypothetical protein
VTRGPCGWVLLRQTGNLPFTSMASPVCPTFHPWPLGRPPRPRLLPALTAWHVRQLACPHRCVDSRQAWAVDGNRKGLRAGRVSARMPPEEELDTILAPAAKWKKQGAWHAPHLTLFFDATGLGAAERMRRAAPRPKM